MWVEIVSVVLSGMNHNCHPLREDVSWNVINPYSLNVFLSSSSWGCELKSSSQYSHSLPNSSSSSWGCELKYYWMNELNRCFVSSSSWGCELKLKGGENNGQKSCHPLREDVSWNILCSISIFIKCSHPLREDVSWNKHITISCKKVFCHPLREDVSWNVIIPY